MPIKTKRKLEQELTEEQKKGLDPAKLYESAFIRVEYSDTETADWEAFTSKLGVNPKFLENPDAAGITFVDENGVFLEDKEKALSRLQNETLYFFTENNGGPYELMCDDQQNLWVNPLPLTLENILGDDHPKKESETITLNQTSLYDDNGNIQQLSAEESISDLEKQLTIEKIQLAQKNLQPPREPKKHNVDILIPDKETFGQHEFFVNKEAPEEIPEDCLPPEPEELTGLQKAWDSFVKFFNRKGSQKGQEYRSAKQHIADERERYPSWRDSFNQRVAQYKADEEERRQLVEQRNRENQEEYTQKLSEYNRQLEEQKEIRSNPNYIKYLDLQAQQNGSSIGYAQQALAEEKLEAEYHEKMRGLLNNNHLAAITDMQKNGITIDNIGAYQNYLENELNQKAPMFNIPDNAENDPTKQPYLSAEDQRMMAQYLIVTQLNNDISGKLNSIKTGKTPPIGNLRGNAAEAVLKSSDLRDVQMRLDILNNPTENEKQLNSFLNEDLFKDTVINLSINTINMSSMNYSGDGKINSQNLVSNYINAAKEQPLRVFTKAEKQLRSELINPANEAKREDIMVKMGILAQRKNSFEVSTFGNSASVNKRIAVERTSFLSWDYAEIKQRWTEMNESFQYYYDISQVPTKEKVKYRDYVEYKKFIDEYDSVSDKLNRMTGSLNADVQNEKDKIKGTGELFGKLSARKNVPDINQKQEKNISTDNPVQKEKLPFLSAKSRLLNELSGDPSRAKVEEILVKLVMVKEAEDRFSDNCTNELLDKQAKSENITELSVEEKIRVAKESMPYINENFEKLLTRYDNLSRDISAGHTLSPKEQADYNEMAPAAAEYRNVLKKNPKIQQLLSAGKAAVIAEFKQHQKANESAQKINQNALKARGLNSIDGLSKQEISEMQQEKSRLEKQFDNQAKSNKSEWNKIKSKGEIVRQENNRIKAGSGMGLSK